MRLDIYNLMLRSVNINSDKLKLNYAEIGRRFNGDLITVKKHYEKGDSAQVDWKESITLETRDGKKVKGNLFLYVLANSRFKYVEFTHKRDQKSFLKCLTHAFEASGGVPRKIWFDNQKVVVFDRCKYSLHPRYIGKNVVLKTDAKKLYIYYKGNVVQEHEKSNKRFNYKKEDMEAILRSDVYRECSEEFIKAYVEKNLKQFDELE